MSPVAWLVVWAIVIAVVAFFTIRAWRAGRRGVPEFDRFQHEAVRQAGMQEDARNPNGFNGSLGGF